MKTWVNNFDIRMIPLLEHIYPILTEYKENGLYINIRPTDDHEDFPLASIEVISECIAIGYLSGKTTFIFDNAGESIFSVQPNYVYKIDRIIKHLNLPNVNYILLVGGPNDIEEFKCIKQTQNISDNLTVLSAFYWEFSTKVNQGGLYRMHTGCTDKPKTKKFLSFNRRPSPHRIALLEKLIENNLLDDAFYSFSQFHPKNIQNINEAFPNIAKYNKEFPLMLNEIPGVTEYTRLGLDDIKYFEQSNFSIVTETLNNQVGVNGLLPVYLTEKIFKCIIIQHPFIVVSTSGYLKVLRSRGYKTFHPYIDEGYDNVVDSKERLNLIVDEVKRLCSMDEKEQAEWNNLVQPILAFNKNIYYNQKTYHIGD